MFLCFFIFWWCQYIQVLFYFKFYIIYVSYRPPLENNHVAATSLWAHFHYFFLTQELFVGPLGSTWLFLLLFFFFYFTFFFLIIHSTINFFSKRLNKLFLNRPQIGGLTRWNQFFEKMNSMFWKELVFSKDKFHDFYEVFIETHLLSFERHGKLWVADNNFHINPLLAPHFFFFYY